MGGDPSKIVDILPSPWEESPDDPGVFVPLFLFLELREVPFKIRGSIGTFHSLVCVFVLL